MLRLNFLLLVAVMVSALYLVQTQYAARSLYTEVHRANNESRQLASEHLRLQVELRAQSAPARIESLALQQGMQGVSPAITHYVQDKAGDGVH